MAYYTGTQAASATIASDFMTTFDTYLISGGFTFVETYTSGTDVTNVYKSPAGSNSLAMDWYLFVNRTATNATNVSFTPSEAYNSTTHLATKYAPYGVPTTANTTDYTVSDAGVLPSATTSGASLFRTAGGNNPSGTGTINTTTAYTWYLNVTPDRVIFGKSTSAGGSPASTTYVGICDPLVDNWNVVIATLTLVGSTSQAGSINTFGAMTRDYGIPATVSTATGAGYVWHCVNSSAYINGLASYFWGPSIGSSYNDAIYGNGTPRPVRYLLFTARNYLIPIFLIKDVILHSDAALATTIAGGDTLALTNSTGTYNYVRSDSYGLTSGLTTWIPKQ